MDNNKGQQSKLKCKYCGQSVLRNGIFYTRVFDKFRKEWQDLSKEDQGNAISELRKNDGIFPTLNMDRSSHLCGQTKKFFEEIESQIIKKLEPLVKEIVSKIINPINSRIYKQECHMDELENNLSDNIQSQIKQILKNLGIYK